MRAEKMEDAQQDSGGEIRSDNRPSDRALLRQFRLGNEDAAEVLYYRYAHRLGALVRSRRPSDLANLVDDEDIVQSAFGSFFRGVNGGSYDVPAGQELWHLLLVITLNKIRAKGVFYRAGKRDIRQTIGGDALDRNAGDFKSVHDTYVFLKVVVDEALGRLPAQYQQAVRLRMEGFEVAEIAEKLGR